MQSLTTPKRLLDCARGKTTTPLTGKLRLEALLGEPRTCSTSRTMQAWTTPVSQSQSQRGPDNCLQMAQPRTRLSIMHLRTMTMSNRCMRCKAAFHEPAIQYSTFFKPTRTHVRLDIALESCELEQTMHDLYLQSGLRHLSVTEQFDVSHAIVLSGVNFCSRVLDCLNCTMHWEL